MIVIGKFKVQEAKSGSKLVYRIRHANNVDIKITLNHIVLDLNKWDNFSQSFRYKRTEKDYKKSLEVNNSVILFSQFIQEEIYSPEIKNNKLTSKWLREKYYDFFGFENPNQNKDKIDDEPYFIDYYNHYISTNKKIEGQAKNGKNLSQNTIKGYTTMIKCWKQFNIYNKTVDIKLRDIDLNIFDKFVYFQESQQKLGSGTIDTNINKLKAILRFAMQKKIEVSQDFIHGTFTYSPEDSISIYLNENDIDKILKTNFPCGSYMDNAKDWFIIQLFSALRISDLFQLNSDHFQKEFIELTTVKTKKEIVIPIFNPIRKILVKNRGKLPRKISDVKYNEYIKLICKEAGIDEIVRGSKSIIIGKGKNKKKRKIVDDYPKWELVTSHTCRRSFLTNASQHAGVTLVDLLAISGHTNTTMLERYIKTSNHTRANNVKERLAEIY
ncbi:MULTISPECIES: phage integrase SAM-like domain-containing protein [unclassified Empedobacter]|uniref:phage integrase SAM-like domain-containing protein n=1 Tax=unclassified Empedobacter TaxID=2643773 RepID=UPI0025BAF47B|nr:MULTISPECIES: phage integrase SAM-like domain-containing protein [unclassified Empedobacter]